MIGKRTRQASAYCLPFFTKRPASIAFRAHAFRSDVFPAPESPSGALPVAMGTKDPAISFGERESAEES